MMGGRLKVAGSGAGNWDPGDVTGTLRSMVGGNGNACTLGGNTGVGQGVECVKRRKNSEIVAKAAALSDWTLSNGVAVFG